MPQISQVLRKRIIGMLTAEISTGAFDRELNVNFSTISRFISMSNHSHNRQFTDVVNIVPHGGGGVMVRAGISYGQ